MITYLKSMEGWKHKDLKSKDFDSIKELFDKAFKRVNMFMDYRIELVEGSSKRAREELEQESTKKQKVDEDKETTELKQLVEIILDEEEVTIDVIPLVVKSPRIDDWKIHKEGKKSYYQIIRADGKSQMYRVFSQMLKRFDREDLEDLYKLIKAKYGSIRPVEDMDYLLWNDIKIMFEPHVEDEIWKLQQGYKVLEWKLCDSCKISLTRSFRLIISVKWYISFLNFSQNSLRINEVFGSILLVIMELLMEKLDDFGDKYQVYGRIVMIKSLLNVVSVIAALIDVNAAQSKLVLLENFNENYSKCLRLLVKLQLPVQSYYC
ncbi:hypothetical protein Tco_1088142 [Tanacetum coccineum]